MNSPVLGLDIGLHRTGVALSESGLIAEPLTTLEWQLPHSQTLIADIIKIIQHHGINTVVVGIPYGEEGDVTHQSQKTKGIVQQLEAAMKRSNLHISLETVNEFNSTQDAQEYYPGVDKDAAAAAIILQNYLEQNGEAW